MKKPFLLLLLILSLQVQGLQAQNDTTQHTQQAVNNTKAPAKENEWETVLKHIDKTLDASLSTALAALALTMAIFLLSYTAPLAAEIKTIIASGNIPSPHKVELKRKLSVLIRQSVQAFFLFLMALAENFALDPLDEKGNILQANDIALVADVTLSAGFLIAGIALLIKSAKLIPQMIE